MFGYEESHNHARRFLEKADALLFGRVTYLMMEEAWRPPGMLAEMPEWMHPFGETIDAAKKYVVSSTLDEVDWNAELVRGDLEQAVRGLKEEPGQGIATGGVMLPLALAELGLIDEFEFVVHPAVAGKGPTPFAGLSKPLDLEPIDRVELSSGVVATTYRPRAA